MSPAVNSFKITRPQVDWTLDHGAAVVTTGIQCGANICDRSMKCLGSVIMQNKVQLYRGFTMVLLK